MRILVTGQMRSGTTLMANVLNAQPGISVLSDFLHIERLQTECGKIPLTSPLSNEQKKLVVKRFIGQPGSDGVQAIIDATGTSLSFDTRIDRFESLLDFYHYIMNQVESAGVETPGHKTTCAEPVIEELLAVEPGVKCIYMLRDPRDVLLSNSKMMKQPAEVVIENWKAGRREILRLMANLKFRNRVLLIRYEDLVRAPLDTLASVATFLERPAFEIPDDVRWYGTKFVSNSSFNDIKQLFDPSGLERWKSADRRLALTVASLAGKDLAEAGYSTPSHIRVGGWLVIRMPHWIRKKFQFCQERSGECVSGSDAA